jgi:hypothetical protein
LKDGEEARELRTLAGALKVGRPFREEDDPDSCLYSFLLSFATEDSHSLSVAGELASSRSPPLLPAPAELEVRLRLEELEFIFPFSFSSNPINIRDRASLYAASRSSIVGRFFECPLVEELLPPKLPASEGSTSESSASSPATEPACDLGFRSCCVRCIILIAGIGAGSAGTRSDILRSGMQLSGVRVMDKTLVAGSTLAGSTSTVVL